MKPNKQEGEGPLKKIQNLLEKRHREYLNDGKPCAKIKPKHWWQYLSPKWWGMKRLLEATMSTKEYKKALDKEIMDEILYGKTIS